MASGDFTRINSNIAALNALNSLKSINNRLGVHQLRLATGKRINSAEDDPAGLTIATKFKYRARGLGTALDNIGDAKNLLAVAEGGLQKINDILIEMRDKALQAASDALGDDERTAIFRQLESYAEQINNIVDETKWNNNALLAGMASKMIFQTGADANEITEFQLSSSHDAITLGVNVSETGSASVEAKTALPVGVSGLATATVGSGLTELASGAYTVEITDYTAETDVAAGSVTFRVLDGNGNAVPIWSGDGNGTVTSRTVTLEQGHNNTVTLELGRGFEFDIHSRTAGTGSFMVDYRASGGSVSNQANATAYLNDVASAIDTVSRNISYIGALSSRLSFKEETLMVARVNTEAAFNRIMNADMAYEQLEATKLQTLQQTATAMLAQANLAPQSVLNLFR